MTFMVWDLGIDKLNEFIQIANEFHPSIKFTAEFSSTSVNYLDTIVKVETLESGEKRLYTDLYTRIQTPTTTYTTPQRTQSTAKLWGIPPN